MFFFAFDFFSGIVEEGSWREAVFAAALPGNQPRPVQRRRVVVGQQRRRSHEGRSLPAARIVSVRLFAIFRSVKIRIITLLD
jgi:hypothetical protein